MENIYSVLITAITILGGGAGFRYYEKRAQKRERDDEFIRHDCKDRIGKLEYLLEQSSKEKDETHRSSRESDRDRKVERRSSRRMESNEETDDDRRKSSSRQTRSSRRHNSSKDRDRDEESDHERKSTRI